MAMNAGDHWPNRRQLDVIPRVRPLAGPRTGAGVKANLICRGQRVFTVRAALCNARDDVVRMWSKRPEHPGTALSLLRRATLGPVGLAPLRGR
jgi:hypothetical protein